MPASGALQRSPHVQASTDRNGTSMMNPAELVAARSNNRLTSRVDNGSGKVTSHSRSHSGRVISRLAIDISSAVIRSHLDPVGLTIEPVDLDAAA